MQTGEESAKVVQGCAPLGGALFHRRFRMAKTTNEKSKATEKQGGDTGAKPTADPVVTYKPIGAPVIILGMHRSGTSFLASHLARRGLHLGEDLLEAREGNKRGHFESMEVMRTHFELLDEAFPGRRELFGEFSSFVPEPPEVDFTEAHHSRAASAVNSLGVDGPWGWKDPRTCLFADLWLDTVPEARLLCIYRHPLEIHDSLLRRGGEPEMGLEFDEARSIRAYVLYTQGMLRALERAAKEERQVAILSAPAAFRDIAAMDAMIDEKLDIGLPGEPGTSDFSAKEFAVLPITERLHKLFARFFPLAAQAYEQMQASAHIPLPFVEADSDEGLAVDRACEAIELLLGGLATAPASPVMLRFLMVAASAGREGGHNGSLEHWFSTARDRFSHLLEAPLWAKREQQRANEEQEKAREMELWAKREQSEREKLIGEAGAAVQIVDTGQVEHIAHLEGVIEEMRAWAESEKASVESYREWVEREVERAEKAETSLGETMTALGLAAGQRDWNEGEILRLRRKSADLERERDIARYRVRRLEEEKRPSATAVGKLRVERSQLEDEYYRTRRELEEIKSSPAYRLLQKMGKAPIDPPADPEA